MIKGLRNQIFFDEEVSEWIDKEEIEFGDLDEFLKQNQLQIEIMAGAVGNVLAKSLRASGDAVKWIADNSDTLTKVLAALIALKVAGVIFGMARALQAMVITTTALVALTGPAGWGLILVATGAAAAAYKLTGDALDSLENSMSESVETAKKQAMAFDDSNRELGIMKAALTQTAKATEKAIVKYKFYEDQIIRVKRSQEAATQSAQEFEDLIADKVIIQALQEVIGEGFTPLQGKIAAIADGMNAFRNTASSALTDVIMGTKKLNEALGEIVNQTLRALIQGFINLGITIFILEPLERWLRNQVQRQKELNSQLKREIALRTILAMFGGGGFGIPFFADGGRTPANQPIVVGERGPELFVPNTAGNVMSNDQLGMGADAFGNISDNVNVTFNINTLDASDFNELLESRQELIIGLINRGLAERGKRSLTA